MKIYLSKPSVLCASGDESALLKDLQNNQTRLKKMEIGGKNFVVGKINDDFFEKNISKNPRFQTRTNDIAAAAILPLKSEIEKLKKKYGAQNLGVIVGTTTSGIEEQFRLFKNGKYDINEFNLDQYSLSNPALFLREFLGLKGVSYSISTACSSGIKALAEAKNLIESGILKAAIVGGIDSLNTLTLFGFDSLSILSNEICKPFCAARDGTNLGEGAAFFIAGDDDIGEIEIKAVSSNCDAFHMTSPRIDGFYQTKLIKEVLARANLNDVDYINLHATGTKINDEMESAAIFNANLKAKASGIKHIIGHTLGAAGAVESAVCAMLLGENFLPIQNGDDESLKPINLVKSPTKIRVKNALNLSFAFGGDNGAIILGV